MHNRSTLAFVAAGLALTGCGAAGGHSSGATLAVAPSATSRCAVAPSGPVAPPPAPGPVADSQNAGAAPAFTGHAVSPHSLGPLTAYTPDISLMHGDAGNTDTSDCASPVGDDVAVGSAQSLSLTPEMWGVDGSLTTGCVSPQPTGILRCIAAVDPRTMTPYARWLPPTGQTLQLAYAVLDRTTKNVVIGSAQGHIFVVHRSDNANSTTFTLLRNIDVSSSLGAGETLLATAPDATGRIWFATGGVLGAGDRPAPSTTIGYVDADDSLHVLHLDAQVVENGFAVDRDTIYVDTGPPDTSVSNVGYLIALHATVRGVGELWREQYDAGAARKPGGFARGSGATVTLLGHDYVTITDNASPRIHVLVYAEGEVPTGASRLVCSVPIFQSGRSASDVSPISVRVSDTYSIVVTNDYNAPPLNLGAPNNGPGNDMTAMAPGVARVDVGPGAHHCRVAWTIPIRTKTVPYLSTRSGLLYLYTQDETLARSGLWVWYFTAVDYRTGHVVWQARAGAGGTKNDDYAPMSIGPTGDVYQNFPLGVAFVLDRNRS
jgi:hypothetical protein